MLGYLGAPEKTSEVLRNGWYVTGDIASLDEDGFIRITDRLSRFSKIAGEMVPHIRVEETINQILGGDHHVPVGQEAVDSFMETDRVLLHSPGSALFRTVQQLAKNLQSRPKVPEKIASLLLAHGDQILQAGPESPHGHR